MPDRALVVYSGLDRQVEGAPGGDVEWMDWREFLLAGRRRLGSFDRLVLLPPAVPWSNMASMRIGTRIVWGVPWNGELIEPKPILYSSIVERIRGGARAVFCVPRRVAGTTPDDVADDPFAQTWQLIDETLRVEIDQLPHPEADGILDFTDAGKPWMRYVKQNRPLHQLRRSVVAAPPREWPDPVTTVAPLAYLSRRSYDPVALLCVVGAGFAVVVPTPRSPSDEAAVLLDALARTHGPATDGGPSTAARAAQDRELFGVREICRALRDEEYEVGEHAVGAAVRNGRIRSRIATKRGHHCRAVKFTDALRWIQERRSQHRARLAPGPDSFLP